MQIEDFRALVDTRAGGKKYLVYHHDACKFAAFGGTFHRSHSLSDGNDKLLTSMSARNVVRARRDHKITRIFNAMRGA